MAAKIKKGDTVIVTTGKSKGQTGIVLRMVDAGKRLVVEGANMVKKHQKPNPQANVEGGVIAKEAPVHHSNVQIYNPVTKKADRVTFKFITSGDKTKKVRCFASSGEQIDV